MVVLIWSAYQQTLVDYACIKSFYSTCIPQQMFLLHKMTGSNEILPQDVSIRHTKGIGVNHTHSKSLLHYMYLTAVVKGVFFNV